MVYETIIIDDDKIICMLINKILEKSGLPKARVFQQAKDALKAIEAENTEKKCCLVFLDINMPIMDGWGFLDAFGAIKTNNDFHIAILTSSINGSDRDKSSEYDLIFEFLTKPLKLEDIQKFKNYSFLLPFFNNGA